MTQKYLDILKRMEADHKAITAALLLSNRLWTQAQPSLNSKIQAAAKKEINMITEKQNEIICNVLADIVMKNGGLSPSDDKVRERIASTRRELINAFESVNSETGKSRVGAWQMYL